MKRTAESSVKRASKPSTSTSIEAADLRKPMARVTQVALFERQVREQLSASAVELLLDGARVLSEGKWTGASLVLASFDGKPLARKSPFFGSTMLSIDLAVAAPSLREPCTPELVRRAAHLLSTDPRVTRHLRELAEREACRVAGRPIRALFTDARVRTDGNTIHIDLDVEGDVAPSFQKPEAPPVDRMAAAMDLASSTSILPRLRSDGGDGKKKLHGDDGEHGGDDGSDGSSDDG